VKKNYENRSIFASVITKINVSRFFYGPQCRHNLEEAEELPLCIWLVLSVSICIF